jgi:hypothetical protein
LGRTRGVVAGHISTNAIRDNATAKRLVGILETHGWLAKIKDGAVVKGQKRREVWKIIRE